MVLVQKIISIVIVDLKEADTDLEGVRGSVLDMIENVAECAWDDSTV